MKSSRLTPISCGCQAMNRPLKPNNTLPRYRLLGMEPRPNRLAACQMELHARLLPYHRSAVLRGYRLLCLEEGWAPPRQWNADAVIGQRSQRLSIRPPRPCICMLGHPHVHSFRDPARWGPKPVVAQSLIGVCSRRRAAHAIRSRPHIHTLSEC